MWEDIMLSTATALGEAVCVNWIDRGKREKINNKIVSLIEENMNSFADTSLDCNEFHIFVQSRNFVEIFKNYFCSIRDGMSNSEYMNSIEEYIYRECPSVKHIEVRDFIYKIKDLYESYLHKMIMESHDLNITFQLMTISHRDIMSKISESEDNMKRYFASLVNDRVQIKNEEINAYHEVCRKPANKKSSVF